MPVVLYITSVALFRAAAQSFIACSCHAVGFQVVVIPRFRVTVGGGRLPGTESLLALGSRASVS